MIKDPGDGYPVVLTADRTLMSDYGRALFLGFLAPGPRRYFWFNPGLLFRFIIKRVKTNPDGSTILAPQGLRRIEAALIESGIPADQLIVCPPWKLSKVMGKSTQVIGISAFDPLGMGPASTTFSGEYGAIQAESHTAFEFRKLIRSKLIQGARAHGALVVVGGSGAWQLNEQIMAEYGIDLAIVGEAELIFPQLVSKILNDGWDGELPAILSLGLNDAPHGNQIPILRGATIGGLVEISRGCGRGCAFCIPTLQRLRHRPLEQILEDIKINIRYGQTHICLSCEDVLQYGGRPLRKDPGAVLKLFQSAIQIPGLSSLGFAHANLASICELESILTQICSTLGLDGNRWIGFQTGIETGSPRLIAKLMRYKPAPYTPQQWPEIVLKGFGICADHGLVPCATLIVNLPGETESDIIASLELVQDLRNFKSLLVPLLYVPRPGEPGKPMRLIKDAQWYHLELYKAIWNHDMKWLPQLARDYLSKSHSLTRFFMRLLLEYILRYVNSRAVKYLDKLIEQKRRMQTTLC